MESIIPYKIHIHSDNPVSTVIIPSEEYLRFGTCNIDVVLFSIHGNKSIHNPYLSLNVNQKHSTSVSVDGTTIQNIPFINRLCMIPIMYNTSYDTTANIWRETPYSTLKLDKAVKNYASIPNNELIFRIVKEDGTIWNEVFTHYDIEILINNI